MLLPTEPSQRPLQRGLKRACCTEKNQFYCILLIPGPGSCKAMPWRHRPAVFRAKLRLPSKFSSAQVCSFPLFHLAPSRCGYNLKSRVNKLNLFQVDCLLFFKLIIIHVNSNDCVIFGRGEITGEEKVWYKGRVRSGSVSEKTLCLVALPVLPCWNPSTQVLMAPIPHL